MTDKTYCLPDGTVLTMPASAAQHLADLEAKNAVLRKTLDAFRAELSESTLVMDAARAELARLQAENERLRSMLPSAATRNALRRAMVDAGWSHSDNAHVWAWLERLERP